jgi:hypothetical protein
MKEVSHIEALEIQKGGGHILQKWRCPICGHINTLEIFLPIDEFCFDYWCKKDKGKCEMIGYLND